jgi:hypothetical protein
MLAHLVQSSNVAALSYFLNIPTPLDLASQNESLEALAYFFAFKVQALETTSLV